MRMTTVLTYAEVSTVSGELVSRIWVRRGSKPWHV